jgi:hypothetical protein
MCMLVQIRAHLIKLHETFPQTIHFISVNCPHVSARSQILLRIPQISQKPPNVQLEVETMFSKSWEVPTEPRRRWTLCMAAALGWEGWSIGGGGRGESG